MHELSRSGAAPEIRRPDVTRPKPGGHPHAGLRFYVWDEDARFAASWAAQLADVEQSVEARRPPPGA